MAGEVIPLGARLKQRRKELGLSQAQAARELEVARTAYRLWEMEAARPAPDRWRLIAKWLGISVTATLLAAELIGEQEALDAEHMAVLSGMSSAGWDDRSGDSEGDFFSQERAMIDDQTRSGNLTPGQAAHLRDVVTRLQDANADAETRHPGRFRKRFPITPLAPSLSRAALAATAVGIRVEVMDDAALLTSELVTNSVTHSRSSWVEVAIVLTMDRLRIEVLDQDTETIRPRTPDATGGWGLTIVGQLATRWGVERSNEGKLIWVELDL